MPRSMPRLITCGVICLAVLSLESFASAAGTVNSSADAQSIDNACSQDAATAGCANEKVGTGLIKCLHTYKKANRSYKISPSCRAAIKQMHQDHMAHRQPAPTQSP